MFVIICSTGVLASGDRNYPEMAKIQTGNQNGKAYAKLLREQREDISLASDERMRLYYKGHSLKDISMAEMLSVISGKSIEELLVAKGKTNDGYEVKMEKDEDGKDKPVIIDNGYSKWEQAIVKLGIDLKESILKLGVTEKEYQDAIMHSIYTIEIFQLATLSANYDKLFSELKEELKDGKDLIDIEIKCVRGNAKKEAGPELVIQNEPQAPGSQVELIIRNAYKITDEEVEVFKHNGITEFEDMGKAKHLSAKYKVQVPEIIKLKRDISDWQQLEIELGGDGE